MIPVLEAETFDLARLPAGVISRVEVQVAVDGTGRPVRVPMLVAKGRKPGPVFGLTACLHGDELNGIPVIQRLFKHLDPNTLRGTIAAVLICNLPGYMEQTRYFPDGRDLNHVFPGRVDGNSAEQYVHSLFAKVVSKFDILLDLHTASVGRVNSLYVRADMTDADTARLAYLLKPQIIVHNPPNDRTMRGAAAAHGITAITVEIANPMRFNTAAIKRTVAGIRLILAARQMTRKRQVVLGEQPVLCARSGWIYTSDGGLLSVLPGLTEGVQAGEVIARLKNPFGDITAEYTAPHDGIIIGHSVNPVAVTGSRIAHIGQIADPTDHSFHRRTT